MQTVNIAYLQCVCTLWSDRVHLKEWCQHCLKEGTDSIGLKHMHKVSVHMLGFCLYPSNG